MDQLKKQHDSAYQLKIQQGEIREKRSIGTLPYPTKKKANYIEKKLWDTSHEQAKRKETCFSRSP